MPKRIENHEVTDQFLYSEASVMVTPQLPPVKLGLSHEMVLEMAYTVIERMDIDDMQVLLLQESTLKGIQVLIKYQQTNSPVVRPCAKCGILTANPTLCEECCISLTVVSVVVE